MCSTINSCIENWWAYTETRRSLCSFASNDDGSYSQLSCSECSQVCIAFAFLTFFLIKKNVILIEEFDTKRISKVLCFLETMQLKQKIYDFFPFCDVFSKISYAGIYWILAKSHIILAIMHCAIFFLAIKFCPIPTAMIPIVSGDSRNIRLIFFPFFGKNWKLLFVFFIILFAETI